MKVDHKLSNIKSVLRSIPASFNTTREEKNLRIYNNHRSLDNIRREIALLISRVDTHASSIDEYKSSEEGSKKEKVILKIRKARIKTHQEEIRKCVDEVNGLHKERERLELEVDLLRAQLKLGDEDVAYRKSLVEEVSFLKQHMKIHSFILGLFESNYLGIRSTKLVDELNSRLEYLMIKMGFSFSCEVGLDVDNELSSLFIFDKERKKVPLVLKSEEEKLALAICFQIAFSSLAKTTLKAGWSMFMFSSIFDTLSNVGLFDKACLLLRNDFNFSQVFVTTNNETIKSKVDYLLTVGRDINGTAYSSWG